MPYISDILVTSVIGWNGRGGLKSIADGVFLLTPEEAGDVQVAFGGETSAYPMLKRSATDIQARLADDSGFSGLAGSVFASYKTYIDASNYSRLRTHYDSGANEFRILSEAIGTESVIPVKIGRVNNGHIHLASGDVVLHDGNAGLRFSSGSFSPQGISGIISLGFNGSSRFKTAWLTGLDVSSGAVTADAPVRFAQTWNEGSTAFTAFDIDVTSTDSDPQSLLQNWKVGGVSKASLRKDGAFRVAAGGALGFIGQGGIVSQADGVFSLVADNGSTPGTLSVASYLFATGSEFRSSVANKTTQQNGTNAQSFAVYETWTSDTNWAGGIIDTITTADTVRIGSDKGSGGGAALPVHLISGGVTRVTLADTGQTTIAAGTLTDPAATTITQTWNDAGDTFTAFEIAVTDTDSATGSMLQSWKVDGSIVASVKKDGTIGKDGCGGLKASADGDFSIVEDDGSTLGTLRVRKKPLVIVNRETPGNAVDGDQGALCEFTTGSAADYTIRHHDDFPCDVGIEIAICAAGDGAITVVPVDASVTILSSGDLYTTAAKEAIITLVKVVNSTTDVWRMTGERV